MEGKNIVDEFFENFKDLKHKSNLAQGEVSKVDKELSTLYHKIEGINIKHVSEGYNLFKELKEVLNRRRLIKYDAILLRSLIDSLGSPIGDALIKNKHVTNKHNQIITSLDKNHNKK